jgi:hypothetical protein
MRRALLLLSGAERCTEVLGRTNDTWQTVEVVLIGRLARAFLLTAAANESSLARTVSSAGVVWLNSLFIHLHHPCASSVTGQDQIATGAYSWVRAPGEEFVPIQPSAATQTKQRLKIGYSRAFVHHGACDNTRGHGSSVRRLLRWARLSLGQSSPPSWQFFGANKLLPGFVPASGKVS